MPTRTDQELVNFVAEKLRAQGRPSLGEEGDNCQYRGPNGLRCAAGWLLADEHYTPWLEACAVGVTRVRQALIASGVSPAQIRLVGELQNAHDNSGCDNFVVKFNDALQEICEEVGLTYPPHTENQ
jgi:hypothetical protein